MDLLSFPSENRRAYCRWICVVEKSWKTILFLNIQKLAVCHKEYIISNCSSIIDGGGKVHAPEKRNNIFIWKRHWMRKQAFNISRPSHGRISTAQQSGKQSTTAFTSSPQPWYRDSNKAHWLWHATFLILMFKDPWGGLGRSPFLLTLRKVHFCPSS